MITFPNAKINIGLYITGKRPDGYHNLVSCFFPVPWHDALEIMESSELSFQSSGIQIPGSSDHNLCLKAYHLLASDFNIPAVNIHLLKKIPIGAGLGGGSSDATFTLKACNDLFDLNLEEHQLENYAARLGSDCPFFVKNQPVIARGTGNDFEATALDLKGKYLAMVNPDMHVSTAEAYGGLIKYSPEPNLQEWLKLPVSRWQEKIENDFEISIFAQYPKIAKVKDILYKNGALYASMSGSGATVYGIFENEIDLNSFFPKNFEVKAAFI